jgi:TonB family protein
MKILLFRILAVLGCCISCMAQVSARAEAAPHGKASLSKLSPPAYPPMARIARVLGQVEIAVKIREDGTVDSATVVMSASPLLNEAALSSARQSQFDCAHCDQATPPYVLTYNFEIATRDPTKDCNEAEPTPPPAQVDASKHQVTVSTLPMFTCDPSAEFIKVRSAKCLYLWKCSVRYPL